jgi:hypothetical protein
MDSYGHCEFCGHEVLFLDSPCDRAPDKQHHNREVRVARETAAAPGAGVNWDDVAP